MGIKRNWQAHIGLLAGYLGLALVLTWPTIVHLTTHLPGDGGDDPAIAWNLWWVKYSLLTLRQNPFQTDFMFYPIGINLTFYTLTVLNGLTALPLLLNVGLVGASNLHLLFTFVAGGYGTFLLTRHLLAGSGRNAWFAAALAGGFFAFASNKLFYVALGQFNIASAHWLPFTILYILKSRHDRRPLRWGGHRLRGVSSAPLLAALFLTLQTWTEMTYASFLLVFLALYALYWLGLDAWSAVTAVGPRAMLRQLWRHPLLRNLTVMGGAMLPGVAPILANMLPDLNAEGDFFVVGGGFADAFSADLAGFLLPSMHHPWLGNLVQQTNIAAYDKGQHIYLGYVLLALAAWGAWTRRRDAAVRFWLVAAVVFAVLALGPRITVNGVETGLAGPFRVLQTIPFLKGNRYPSRYSVPLVLSLAVLAAPGIAHLGRRLAGRRTWLLLAIALAFLFEHLSVPLPQSDMTIPAPYNVIAQDDGEFTVLDIPFAWRNGFRLTGAWTTGFMFGQFYQTYHQKRLLQGNTSRNPEFKFQYFTEAPVISTLLALETGHELPPERWQADRAIAPAVLRFFDIKYIVVRPEPPGYLNDPRATLPYIEEVLPVTKLHESADLILYRVDLGPPAARLVIDSRTDLVPLYLGEGWGRIVPGEPLLAQRRTTRLFVPLDGGAQRVTLRLRLPADSSGPRRFWLALNGWQSARIPLEGELRTYRLDIPAGAVNLGLNEIRLHVDRLDAAAEMLPPALTVVSAGEEVGDFGHIYLNGRDASPNERGYNAAIISAGGALLAAASFDTHQGADASRALAEFLAAAPDDAFVALAVADEASANLTEEAVQALRSLGARGDLRGCFRCSHAFLRTPDGTTLEALEPLGPASVAVGWGLTEPQAAVLVESVVFETVVE
ncbi:MAG: interleukin-like EMT inducer domain-containing protein [Anaerolineae bacterium]